MRIDYSDNISKGKFKLKSSNNDAPDIWRNPVRHIVMVSHGEKMWLPGYVSITKKLKFRVVSFWKNQASLTPNINAMPRE